MNSPRYDAATRTHYIEVNRETLDAARGGIILLSLHLFADSVSQGEWAWLECDGDELLLEIKDIAAVGHVSPVQP